MKMVKPTPEQSERMKKQILNYSFNSHEKTTLRYRRFPVGKTAAAVLLVVMILSTTAFADEVKNIFQGFLKNEDPTREYTQENVFEDNDGHVKIQIMELVSDEVSVQMTVKYEALDESGKQWLNSSDITNMDNEQLSIQPDFQGNTIKYGTNLTSGYTELEEYKSSTARFYYVACTNSNWNPSICQGKFSYQLSDGAHTAMLDLSCNVPVYEYSLHAVNDQKLSQYYEPTYIRLSPLSYVVYGKNQGLFSKTIRGDGEYDICKSLLSDEISKEEDIKKVFFLKEDGTYTDPVSVEFYLGDLATETVKAGSGYDCLVVSGELTNIEEQLWFDEKSAEIIELENITGVKISNENKTIEYEFVK